MANQIGFHPGARMTATNRVSSHSSTYESCASVGAFDCAASGTGVAFRRARSVGPRRRTQRRSACRRRGTISLFRELNHGSQNDVRIGRPVGGGRDRPRHAGNGSRATVLSQWKVCVLRVDVLLRRHIQLRGDDDGLLSMCRDPRADEPRWDDRSPTGPGHSAPSAGA